VVREAAAGAGGLDVDVDLCVFLLEPFGHRRRQREDGRTAGDVDGTGEFAAGAAITTVPAAVPALRTSGEPHRPDRPGRREKRPT
jgi:hypothetical protein